MQLVNSMARKKQLLLLFLLMGVLVGTVSLACVLTGSAERFVEAMAGVGISILFITATTTTLYAILTKRVRYGLRLYAPLWILFLIVLLIGAGATGDLNKLIGDMLLYSAVSAVAGVSLMAVFELESRWIY